MAKLKIHPSVDDGVKPGAKGFKGGTLTCKLEPYDCLSPALMDAISTHVAKQKGILAG